MKRLIKNKTFNILLLVVLVLLITVDCVYSYKRFGEVVEETSTSQIAEWVESLVNQQNDELTVIAQSLKSYVRTVAAVTCSDGLPDAGDIKEYLTAIEDAGNQGDVIIADKEGNAVDSNGDVYDISRKIYFKKAIKGEETISETTISGRNGEKVIVIAAPIEYEDEYVGIVCYVLPLDAVSSIISDDFVSEIGNIIITESGGQIVASTRDDIEIGTNIEEDEAFLKEIGEENIGRFTEHSSSESADAVGDEPSEKPSDKLSEKPDTQPSKSPGDETESTESESADATFVGANDNCYITKIYNEESGWTIISIIEAESVVSYTTELNSNAMKYVTVFIFSIMVFIILFIAILSNLLFLSNRENKTLETEKDIMAYKALHDPMTGLYNKGRFLYVAEKELEENTDKRHALFFIDVDDFKKYNDTYGHGVGDEVLVGFSDVLRNTFRKDDHFGRFGGDEFVVMVNNYEKTEDVEKFVKRLYDKTGEKTFSAFDGHITISVGIAEWNNEDLDKLMERADEALYKSKNAGKNQYTFAE
ncbi:MAG: diguanylate cyclase [Eubacterium sp.]|nr:diguanylate cyclase [Eubacterium sp.]